MKLQNKLLITILTIFIISIIFLGILVFSNSKKTLEDQIILELQSNSQITEEVINTFLLQQKDKLELMATQDELTLEELNTMLTLDEVFYDFFVIDSNGFVNISTNPERIGLYRGNRDYFTQARNQTHISKIYFALVPKQYSISVSTPFHGGVLVGAMDLNIFNQITKDKVGLGETYETLLAFKDENESLIYFTKRKFSDKSIEILEKGTYETRPISLAINQKETVTKAPDYRDVETIVATNYIELIEVGMVTKIDIEEAFSKVSNLQKVTILLVALITSIVSFIIYILSKAISKELNNLTSNIDQITQGNLEIELEESKTTEIQSLIASLNRILASMKLAILRTGLSKEQLGIGEIKKQKQILEDKYKIIYESTNDAVMTLEPPKWNFTAGNPAAVKLFKAKSEKEFISTAPWQLSPKYQPDGKLSMEKAKKMIEKAMKEGSNYFEWVHKNLEGKEFFASVLLSRIKDGKTYLQATVRDISKEQKVEELSLLHNEIVKNMTEGVYIVGIDDVIIKYATPKFEKMFGYKKGEMIGKHASIVNAPTDKSPKKRAGEIMTIIKKTGEWHGEVKNIKKDGTPFWCYANVSTFNHPKYGKVLLAVHSIIDKPIKEKK